MGACYEQRGLVFLVHSARSQDLLLSYPILKNYGQQKGFKKYILGAVSSCLECCMVALHEREGKSHFKNKKFLTVTVAPAGKRECYSPSCYLATAGIK